MALCETVAPACAHLRAHVCARMCVACVLACSALQAPTREKCLDALQKKKVELCNWEFTTPVPPADGIYTIKYCAKKYDWSEKLCEHLRSCADQRPVAGQGTEMICDRIAGFGIDSKNDEFFTFAKLGDGRFTIKGNRLGKYCSDQKAGIICDKDSDEIGDNEKFSSYLLHDGTYAIKGGRDVKYCGATGTGLVCDKDEIGPTEKFILYARNNIGALVPVESVPAERVVTSTSEGQSGTCDGEMRMGSATGPQGAQWSSWQCNTGTFACNYASFAGGDPYPGHHKVCECRAQASCTSTKTYIGLGSECSIEGGNCACTGQARYGDGTKFSSWKDVSAGSIRCNNAVFGDSSPGVPKRCYCRT